MRMRSRRNPGSNYKVASDTFAIRAKVRRCRPSTPASSDGSRGAGVSAYRLTKGIGDDHFDPPIDAGDRTFFGPGDLRMWAVTSQWRGVERGIEVNFGVGVGGHGSRDEQLITGIRRGGVGDEDEVIDPIAPLYIRQRTGSGFIALDLLVGRRLFGPLHVKGGFTYGLAGDLHPFQPVLVFALSRR